MPESGYNCNPVSARTDMRYSPPVKMVQQMILQHPVDSGGVAVTIYRMLHDVV